MRNSIKITLQVAVICFLLMASCSKKGTQKDESTEINPDSEVSNNNPSSPEEILNCIRSLGFSDSDIVDAGNEYI